MLAGIALLFPMGALGNSLTATELEEVNKRLVQVRPYSSKLKITAGDTIFIERSKSIKALRMRKGKLDYEGKVSGVVAPSGIVVHPRVDSISYTKRGKKIDVLFRYAIHVDPGGRRSGKVSFTLQLTERAGLGNIVVQDKVKHWITVQRLGQVDKKALTADFLGYRHFNRQSRGLLSKLRSKVRRLSLKDLSRVPPIDRLDPKSTSRVFAFLQSRRRMWVAHRHLVAASQSPDPQTASFAKTLLQNLASPDAKLAGLPLVALAAQAPPPPTAEVETLEPTRTEPAPPPSGTGDTLSPVTTYDPDTESQRPPPTTGRRPPPPTITKTGPDPKTGPKSGPPKPPGPKAVNQTGNPTGEGVTVLSDDPLAERRLRRIITIPGYTRGLVMDDPNIAHGAAVRMSWANVTLRERAVASALFYNAQVSITPDIGLELTVPTQYVNISPDEDDRFRSVYTLGNPLLSAKYRLYLPKVLERQPALTIRARWAIPFAPLHKVPPSELGVEDFTTQAHFTDTYAFFLEKTDLGLGVNFAWQWDMLYVGAQLYADYFFPVGGSLDRQSFFTLNYGASVGVLPFGEIVGAYLEGRATSLFAGPGRTEFFVYGGFRGRLLDYIEPAVWVAFPLGSIRDVSGLQIGAELRFSYDVEAIVDSGKLNRSDDILLE